MPKDPILSLKINAVGADDVKKAIIGIGQSAVASAKAAKDASAETRKTADEAKKTWQAAEAAAASASKSERAARRQTASEAKSAYAQAEQSARQAARVESDASRNTLAVLRQTSRSIVQADKDIAASGVSASRARAQAAKDSATVQKQATKDAAAAQKQADDDSQTSMQRRLKMADTAFNGSKYSGAKEALGSVQGYGLALGGAGLAGGAIIGKGLMDADEIARTRKALTFSLGSEGEADKRIGELKDIDRGSSFDFQGLSANLNNLVGKGFSGQEAMDLLRSVGDTVARTQGGQEELNSVIRQLAQVKSSGRASLQDLNAMAESGGLPIGRILGKSLSPERLAGAMGGGEPLKADEFFKAFSAGMVDYKNGMKEANDSLRGDLSNLSSALYQASDATKALLSPVRSTIQAVTAAVDWFAKLPKPIQDIVAYGGGAGVVFAVLAGGTISFLASVGKASIGLRELKEAIDRMGNSATKNALKTPTGGAPTAAGNATNTVAAAGAGAVAGGATTVAGAAADTAAVGFFGTVTAGAVALAARVTSLLNPVARGVAAGYALDQGAAAVGLLNPEQSFLERQQRGLGRIADFITRNPGHYDKADDAASAPSPATTPVAAAIAATAAKPSGDSIVPVMGGAPILTPNEAIVRESQSPEVQKSAGAVDALQGEIDGLNAEKRGATKERKAVIAATLAEKRLQLRDARQELSATKTLSAQAAREAKASQRLADKGAGYEADVEAVRDELAFNSRIDDLQIQLDKAKDENDSAQIKALTLEIESEKAKQALALARAEAAKTAITDAPKAAAMNQIADLKFADSMRRAGTTAERARLNAVDSGAGKAPKLDQSQVAALFSATGASAAQMLGTRTLDPSGSAGAGSRFAGMVANYDSSGVGGGYSFAQGVPSAGAFSSRKSDEDFKKERRIRVQMAQKNGKRVISFKADDIELPYEDPFGGWDGD